MTVYKRRITREKVLQTLYAYEISKEPISSVVENVLGDIRGDRESFDFAKKLIDQVVSHQEEIEVRIRAKVSHWEYNRIAVIDKLLLQMGICEFLYFPDIPPKVTINELIEVAKTFSTEQSGKFVNGILDAILDELKKNSGLKKTGRGLINENASQKSGRTGPPPDPAA
ncbi:MAG TPA: transcription antitermination factor NusB [Bacteroidota bacterium]|jgi:N utilization substance protein B